MRNRNPLQKDLFLKVEQESDIQKRIGKILLMKRFIVIRFNSGGMFANGSYIRFYTLLNNGKSSGLPDLAFMRNGKVWFIEVKGPSGKLKDSQTEFIRLAKDYDIPVMVTNSWEDVLDYVNQLSD